MEFVINKYPIDYGIMIKLFRDFECLQYEFQHNDFSSNKSDLHRMQKVAMLTLKKFIADSVNFRDLLDRFDQIIVINFTNGFIIQISKRNHIEFIFIDHILFYSIITDFPFLVEFLRYIQAAWLIQEQIQKM